MIMSEDSVVIQNHFVILSFDRPCKFGLSNNHEIVIILLDYSKDIFEISYFIT